MKPSSKQRSLLIGVLVILTVAVVIANRPPTADPNRTPPERAISAPQDFLDTKDTVVRAGDVVTSEGLSTRYYVAPTMKRYVFTDDQTFATWYPSTFQPKIINRKALEALPLAGNVTQRPGMRVIKFASDPAYYVVVHAGVLRSIAPRLLKSYYGPDWAKRVDQIEEYYRADYTIGAELSSFRDYSPLDQYTSSPTISIDKGVIPSIKVERKQ